MSEIKEEGRRTSRLVARGRDERTPIYLHFGILVAVGAFVAVVVGLVFLVQALA
jgi:hypothetical protein